MKPSTWLNKLFAHPLGDKRYRAARRQLLLACALIPVTTIGLAVVFWLKGNQHPSSSGTENPAPQPTYQPNSLPEKPSPPIESPLADLRHGLRTAIATKDWAEISDTSRKILELDPNDGEAWHSLAWVNEKNLSFDEAATAYGKAIDAGFLPAHSRLKRAQMRRLLQQYSEAIDDLQAAASLDPSSVFAPNLLIICKIQSGEIDGVRSLLAAWETAGINASANQYLLGKAALALHDGDTKKAALALSRLRDLVPAPIFSELLRDPFFDPYQNDPAILNFTFFSK